MRKRTLLNHVMPALLALPALAFLACEDSDPIAPENSEITVTASPNPVNLLLADPDISTITARVLSATGVPVPDGTIVFFDATAGTLSSLEDLTESGIANTVLTVSTATTVTVTARSGGASGQVQVQVVNGAPSSVSLDSSNPEIQLTCADTVDLFGEVLDANGDPIPSLQVSFSVVSSTPSDLGGNFSSALTNSSGQYTSSFAMTNQQCQDECTGGVACTLVIRATAANINSPTLTVSESVP